MEHAIKLIDKNRNQNACILFADLDHLKEINDNFGHTAGDYAIKTASNYLSTVLPSKSVIGRIGGDEFVAIVSLDKNLSASDIKSKLQAYAQKENSNPDIPYYIELSVGFYEFNCDKNIDITELLKRSDSLLYNEKSKRRASIKKYFRILINRVKKMWSFDHIFYNSFSHISSTDAIVASIS